jgi:hypothetical protein
LRASGPLPSDLLALALFPMPARLADQVARLVRRWTVGDLAPWGLTAPRAGPLTHTKRTGRTPTIVDAAVIEAIRARRSEIVADVSSVTVDGVQLADGTTLQPGAIIASTGFGTGLEPMAGHLGVLDDRGMPLAFGGPAVASGLRFTGYVPNIRSLDREARNVAEQVSRELAVTGPASRGADRGYPRRAGGCRELFHPIRPGHAHTRRVIWVSGAGARPARGVRAARHRR